MGQAQKGVERTMATKFVCFSKWKTVARRSGRAESWMEPFGKKGYGGSEELPDKLSPYQKWTSRPWSAWWSQKAKEVSPRCILKYSTREGSDIFQFFDSAEKKDHFVASRRRWESQGKKATKQGGNMSGMKYQVPRSIGESSLVYREDPENADAAAKPAFI